MFQAGHFNDSGVISLRCFNQHKTYFKSFTIINHQNIDDNTFSKAIFQKIFDPILFKNISKCLTNCNINISCVRKSYILFIHSTHLLCFLIVFAYF